MYPHKGPDKGEHTLSAWGIGNQKTLWKVLFAAHNQETNDQRDWNWGVVTCRLEVPLTRSHLHCLECWELDICFLCKKHHFPGFKELFKSWDRVTSGRWDLVEKILPLLVGNDWSRDVYWYLRGGWRDEESWMRWLHPPGVAGLGWYQHTQNTTLDPGA